MGEERCVFCAIAAGRAPASVVHDDEGVLAFMDLQPVNPGGIVVIPRCHVGSLAELEPGLGGRMFAVAVGLAGALRASGLRCEGVNLMLSDGECAGQDVFHSHLLVVPRFDGDTLEITCDWPEPRPRAELDARAAAIRRAIGWQYGAYDASAAGCG